MVTARVAERLQLASSQTTFTISQATSMYTSNRDDRVQLQDAPAAAPGSQNRLLNGATNGPDAL